MTAFKNRAHDIVIIIYDRMTYAKIKFKLNFNQNNMKSTQAILNVYNSMLAKADKLTDIFRYNVFVYVGLKLSSLHIFRIKESPCVCNISTSFCLV